MISLIAYAIALIEFIYAGYLKFNGVEWHWVAYCSIFTATIAIWSKA